MRQEILFISDLHLAIDKPEITQRFVRFLNDIAPKAAAIYILGDLFDTWVGDDDTTPPSRKIRQQLRQVTDSGTRVFFQPGNRDFLLGQKFCRDTGVSLLEDHQVIDLFGTPTLLMHGDLLCTDDIPYQAFRVKSHTPEWRQYVLSKPLLLRLLMARWYRWRSYLHKRKKSLAIMDVNQDAVISTLTKYGCLRLIHGHTHRPAIHDFELNGKPVQRFVLASWDDNQRQILCWNEDGFRLETI